MFCSRSQTARPTPTCTSSTSSSGLYAVAPVLAAFLAGGGAGRAYIFAGTVLASTLLVYVIADLSSLNGAPRPIVLDALTQWVPYVGYFLAGWALRNIAAFLAVGDPRGHRHPRPCSLRRSGSTRIRVATCS